jgi:hypothetical protein
VKAKSLFSKLSPGTRAKIEKIIKQNNYEFSEHRPENIKFLNALQNSGIRFIKQEIIKAIWDIAKHQPFNLDTDESGRSGIVCIWENLSLTDFLNKLDLTLDEFQYPEKITSKATVYFKLRFDFKNKLVIISLHFAKF